MYDNFDAYVDSEFKKAVKRIEFVMNASQQPLISENLDALKETSEDAFAKGLIDFYVLQQADRVALWNYRNIDPELLKEKFQNYDKVLVTNEYVFKVVQVMDYTFVVGMRFVRSEWLWASFQSVATRYFVDLFLVTSSLVFIVWLMLKDILNLSNILSHGQNRKFDQLKANSKEASILLNAATGYQSKTDKLKSKNLTYEGSIGPAIVEEINSGKQAPYVLESTMVRVDLNGYTQIFLSKKEEYITEILNLYFSEAREIINRYEGLVYQYVGDEIVFHIKGPANKSQKMALACVRALFLAANRIEQGLSKEAGHYFKLKASFAFSPIRFIKLDQAFALTGVSLIESARLLSQIEEKTTNMVAFNEAKDSFYTDICKIHSVEEAILKGFEGSRNICRAHEFLSIEKTFETGQYENLAFYRSDEDLVAIQNFLLDHWTNEISFFAVVKQLRLYTVQKSSAEVAAAYLQNLKCFVEANKNYVLSDRALASWVSLCTNLVTSENLTPELAEVLQSLLYHVDARTQANVIIVLGELSRDIEFVRKFMHSKNNRVSADALYVSGKRNLTKEIADQLLSHAQSKNPLFRASAHWVMNQLLQHYERTDEVFYRTSPLLESFRKVVLPNTVDKAA